MYVPQVDKLLHFAVGTGCTLLGLVAGLLAQRLGASASPAWFGLGACALAAVAREAWNRRWGGLLDWRDIAATMGGAGPVLLGYWAGAWG